VAACVARHANAEEPALGIDKGEERAGEVAFAIERLRYCSVRFDCWSFAPDAHGIHCRYNVGYGSSCTSTCAYVTYMCRRGERQGL
jgi:hypothetical protein